MKENKTDWVPNSVLFYLHFSALILVNFNVTTKEITMNQSILSAFGATGEERVINALNAFKQGNGVLVLDDEDQ